MRTQVEPYFLTRDEPVDVRSRTTGAVTLRLRTWQARDRIPVAVVEPLDGRADDPLGYATALGTLLRHCYFVGDLFYFVARTPCGEWWNVNLRPCGPRFFDRPRFIPLDLAELIAMVGPVEE
jgi:hypothetical protein